MIKLRRYYVPYAGAILLAIALLFLQANMDLALPDYLSKIVNVGIQQGGIVSPIPDAISTADFPKLQFHIKNDTHVEKILQAYRIDSEKGLYRLTDESVFSHNPVLRNDFIRAFVLYTVMESEIMKGLEQSNNRPDIDSMIERFSNPLLLEMAAVKAVQQEYKKQGRDTAQIQNDYIVSVGGEMLLIALISALATISVGYIAAKIAAGIARNLRKDLFTKVEHFSAAEFDRFSTASLITRSTNDITQIQMASFMIIRMVFFAPIMGIGGVIRALSKASSMAWIIGVAVLVLLGAIILVMTIAMPKFKIMQKLVDALNKVSREQLSGLMVVRAFNRQDFEKQRFDKANNALTANNLFISRVMVIMMPFIMLVMNLVSVVIIWIGADKVAAMEMQVGDMMAFLQYATYIIMSFLMLSMIFIMLPRASVAAERVAEILNTEESIKDSDDAKALSKTDTRSIEFKNVSFTYPGAEDPALKSVSFKTQAGETTGIIGSTGSGKSTMAHLMLRFYDVSHGQVLLDGEDVRRLHQSDIRNAIAYVPQKASLFSGTIGSNLRYGDVSAADDVIAKASETAQILDFIEASEKQYEMEISQGGANVSGGQKQRLSIARALVKNAGILLFDDSFSALDFKTDAALRRALHKKHNDAALIIIAQRVSTIMHADRILVLDEGRLVGKGTHNELMASCNTYKEIVISQLSIKESGI